MKKLVLLATALLVLSTLVSSPALAHRPSLEFRIHSMFGVLYRAFLLSRGIVVVPSGDEPMINGSGGGAWLGGDADDYGNGRWNAIDETKPINKLISHSPMGPSSAGPDAANSVE
jgi:hypothetical protein